MTRRKKFLFTLVAIVTLMISFTVSAAAAETATQDGLNAVIQTDKDIYAASEDIQIAVTVTNTNAFDVKNVYIENFLPDGLTLKNGSLKSDTVDLSPNETLTLSCVAVLEKSEEPTSSAPIPDDPGTTSSSSPSDEEAASSGITPNEPGATSSAESETTSSQLSASENPSSISSTPIVNSNNSPQTGDSFPYFISFSLLVISAIAIVAIVIAFKREKKIRKIISLILCCAIGASSITAVGFIRASAEETQNTFAVEKTITVGNKGFTIQASVAYSKKEENKDYQELIQGVDIDSVYESQETDISIDEETGIKFINNIIIISFDWNCTDERKAEIINSINGKVVGGIDGFNELHIQVQKSSLKELENIVGFLNKNYDDVYASYDEVTELSFDSLSYEPNDPWNIEQGDVSWDKSKSEFLHPSNWWAVSTDLRGAWTYDKHFHHIDIGIIDDGFLINHEDFLDNNKNSKIKVVSKENSPNDHGSHVAGIIGAIRDNNKGISGIINNSNLYCYDIEDSKGKYEKESKIYKALETLVEEYNCKVVNLSFGTFTYVHDGKYYLDEKHKHQLTNSLVNKRGKKASNAIAKLLENGHDFIVVQAAGNGDKEKLIGGIDSDTVGYFASISSQNCFSNKNISSDDIMDRVIIVANADKISSSDYTEYELDRSSNGGKNVDIAAPGHLIFSTVAGNGQEYAYLTGTSQAAPIVSGIAGLVWSVNENFSGKEVKDIICNSVDKNIIVKDNPNSPTTGDFYMVNAKLAVEEALQRTDNVASISGTIIDAETGEPLEANISATSEDGMMAFATSNPETGDFSIQNLPAGKYNVVISKEGYRNYTFSPTLTDGMIFVLNEPVELEKGLAPTVVGYVTDKDTNEKLEGVTVNAYDQQGYGPWAAATTDATGKFTLTFQDEGAYILKFEKDGYISTTMPTFASKIEGDDELVPMQVTMEKGNDSGEDKPIIDSGTCGESLTWVLYEDGELVISGTGEMWDNSNIYVTPWHWKKYHDKINKVTMDDGITYIGELVFQSCSNLKNIVIPDSVIKIGDSAFRGCTGLEVIYIGNGFRTDIIKVPGLFDGCTSLRKIEIDKNNNYYSSLDGVLFNKDKTKLVVYPCGKEEDSYIIPDTVISIGEGAFSESKLHKIELTNNIKSIGHAAFFYCYNLSDINIPESITTITTSVFANCPKLQDVIIPANINKIDEYAFSGCANLTSVTILNSNCEIYQSRDTISETATIYGYKGSTAEAYATKYGREFVVLD